MGDDPERQTFERELRNLLLRSFADGAEISGEQTISTVPDEIPDWHVTVERRGGRETTEEETTDASAVGESA